MSFIMDIETIHYSRGNEIYKEGDEVDKFYFVYSGEVVLKKNCYIDDINHYIEKKVINNEYLMLNVDYEFYIF